MKSTKPLTNSAIRAPEASGVKRNDVITPMASPRCGRNISGAVMRYREWRIGRRRAPRRRLSLTEQNDFYQLERRIFFFARDADAGTVT